MAGTRRGPAPSTARGPATRDRLPVSLTPAEMARLDAASGADHLTGQAAALARGEWARRAILDCVEASEAQGQRITPPPATTSGRPAHPA